MFPANPTTNQLYKNQTKIWRYTGVAWVKVASTGDLININSTYNIADGANITNLLDLHLNLGDICQLDEGTYYIDRPIVCTTTCYLYGNVASGKVILKPATQTQTGYLFDVHSKYDICGITAIGNNKDGLYFIGTDNVGSNGGNIRKLYLSDFDIGVYFTNNSQHPLGLHYTDIYMQVFNTAGIVIGGNNYNNTSNGEDCWLFENIITTNGWKSDITFANTVVTGSSTDTVSWTPPANAPPFGYTILRSANGSTNWQVPPNWSDVFFTGASFVCKKQIGETWFYKVVRSTFGSIMNRGKNITIVNGHIGEHSTMGMVFINCPTTFISNGYTESRNGTDIGGILPSGAYAMLVSINSDIMVTGGWCECFNYYGICYNGGHINVSNVRWSSPTVIGYGMFLVDSTSFVNYTGRVTPNIPLIVNKNQDAIYSYKAFTNTYDLRMQKTIRSSNTVGLSLECQDTNKFQVNVDNTGSSLFANHPTFINKTKSKQRLLVQNSDIYTTIPNATSTAIFQFDIATTNGAGSVLVDLQASVFYSGACRQSLQTSINISMINTAGSIMASAANDTPRIVIQNGTLSLSSVTIAITGSTVTVYTNIVSSGSGASINCYVNPKLSFGIPISNFKIL